MSVNLRIRIIRAGLHSVDDILAENPLTKINAEKVFGGKEGGI